MLGGITKRRYKLLSKRSEGRTLNQDQLLRTTNVTAIDQSLHQRLSMRKADEWAQTPNKQFYGGASLYNLIAGGPIALWEWRMSLEKQVSEQMKAERNKATDTTTIE
jgi:hypothetical protein